MSYTNDDVKNHDPAQPDEPAWWEEIFRIGEVEEGADPLSEAFFSDYPSAEDAGPAVVPGDSLPTGGCGRVGAVPSRPVGHSRDRSTYTLDKVNELVGVLRALPAKDPSERRLDKQMVIRHIVGEITALQQRGYRLEQVAAFLSNEGVELTTPTLKSYLQRAKKAHGKGARKAPRLAPLPL